MRAGKFLIGCSVAVLAGSAAQADVVISKKPTANMSCSGGVCSPTAAKAVLNATDLANMLAGGDGEFDDSLHIHRRFDREHA